VSSESSEARRSGRRSGRRRSGRRRRRRRIWNLLVTELSSLTFYVPPSPTGSLVY